MLYLTASVSALIAAIGWFYLFYSRAALRLAGIEHDTVNRRRGRLRQIGGGLMVLLGVAMFAGFNSVTAEKQPRAFVVIWIGVCAILLLLVSLGLIDIRLTWRLRKRMLKSDDNGGNES